MLSGFHHPAVTPRWSLRARGIGSPHFGPSNDRVYFYSPQGLLSLRFDGGDRRTLLKVQRAAPADHLRLLKTFA